MFFQINELDNTQFPNKKCKIDVISSIFFLYLQRPKIIDIYVDDKHHFYHKSLGWSQNKNLKTSYLGSGAKTVDGYKIEKSGTATVNGKQCDVFKGKKSGSSVEYYIWEGIVLKKVETFSDGPTSTIVESIELPASIDASKFAIP